MSSVPASSTRSSASAAMRCRSRFEHSSKSGNPRISSTLASVRSSTAGTLVRSRLTCMSQTLALPRALELPGGGRLPRVGSVDAVALEGRAGELAKRSIKRESKLFALGLAVTMIDLTTLEGADTPGKVRALSAKAMRPDPSDDSVPPVAAVCVYPSLAGVARRALAGSDVKVASVATAFPSGQASLEVQL